MDKYNERKQQNRGSLTLEASIIMVIFMSAFIAILSIINIFRAQTVIQNAVNQASKEIAQYTYIIEKAGLADFGEGAAEQAGEFTDNTQEMIGTVFTFFDAAENGLDSAVTTYRSNLERAKNYPTDIILQSNVIKEELEGTLQDAEAVKAAGEAMESAVKDYAQDPQAIFTGLLAVMKNEAQSGIKISIATPIAKSLTNKYLGVYPDGYLENLGVKDGIDGINYWGSSILLDFQSIEVCANYKIKIEVPFLDKIEYRFKVTSSTRAWIGDGAHNENGVKGAVEAVENKKVQRGSELNAFASGLPGNFADENENLAANRAKYVELYGEKAGEIIDIYGSDAVYVLKKFGRNGLDSLIDYGEETIYLLNKYQDKGFNFLKVFRSNNESDVTIDTVMERLDKYGNYYLDLSNGCGLDGMLWVATSEETLSDDLISYYSRYGNDCFDKLLGQKPEDVLKRYEEFKFDGLKISGWDFPPSDEYYRNYRDVYNNSTYFDQATGKAKYPPNDGFGGEAKKFKLGGGDEDIFIDRYSYKEPSSSAINCKDDGNYFSPAGIKYNKRALPPDQQSAYYTKYKVVKEIECTAGEIAPWFGYEGGGMQYFTKQNVTELIKEGYIEVVEIKKNGKVVYPVKKK